MPGELKRVLYLEDDPSIALITRIAIQDHSDLILQHCASGREAINAFSDFKPDLLLFDVMLPDMDGLQTLAEIRALEGDTPTPVIFMTAKAQVHEQKKYLDLGALTVIVKPFDSFTLGKRLKNIWDAKLN